MEFCTCVLWIRASRREEVGESGANMTDLLVGRMESGLEGGVGVSTRPEEGMCKYV